MFCTNCGKQLDDKALFCPYCGARRTAPGAAPEVPGEASEPRMTEPTPPASEDRTDQGFVPRPLWQAEAQAAPGPQAAPGTQAAPEMPAASGPVTAAKRPRRKGLLIGAGCVALAALVGGGIWLLTRLHKPTNRLLAAAQRSAEALEDYTADLPNLHSILENADKLSDSNTEHLDLSYGNHVTNNYNGQSFRQGSTFSLEADLDRAAKQAAVNAGMDVNMYDETLSIPFRFYADQEQLQMGSDALLDKGEAVSLPLKDLAKQWNASELGKLSGIELPEDLDLSAKPDADLEQALEKAYGEDWILLRDSFDTLEYDGDSHFGADGTTYTLSWDRDALKRMYDKTDLDTDELLDIQDLDDLTRIDLNDLAAKIVVTALGEINESVSQQQFYVVDGCLTGIWLEITPEDEEPVQVELRLLGENNLWERLEINVTIGDNGRSSTNTVELALRKQDGSLRAELSAKNDGEILETYAIVYQDADGLITMEEDGEPVEDLPEIRLKPAEQGFSFSVEEHEEYGDSYQIDMELWLLVSGKLNAAVEPISPTPIELLKLSQQELEDLARRIEDKLDELE